MDNILVRREMLSKKLTSGHRVTSKGVKKKFLACKFSNTGQTWGKILKTFATSSVIPDVADAFEAGQEDSVAYKIAVFCGAFGREHLLGDTTKYN